MADVTMSDGAMASLEATSHIPIAQLTPLLAAPSSRSLKAMVTLTWPYSSATGSMAFLLVEPDFRLRRTKGQVRVQFSRSSARAVAKSGIASGDEVTLCLDGVEWLKDESANGTPGRGVECELKFTERLLLQFRQEGSQQVNLIDINHPESEPEPVRVPSSSTQNGIPPLEPTEPHSPLTARPDLVTQISNNEWSSPAFIKRARTSYGSLFDTSYDPFEEEDGTVAGKGRKRIKSSRVSRQWRYASRTPSPELEEPEEEPVESVSPAPERVAPTTSAMTDAANQTIDLEDGSAAETLANLSRQPTTPGIDLNAIDSSISFANETAVGVQAHGEIALPVEDPANAMLPPNIVIAQGPIGEFSQQEYLQTGMPEVKFDHTVTVQQPPMSPRLQPLSSDGLPLVSPLVESRFGIFGAPSSAGPLDFGYSWVDQTTTSVTVEEPSMAEERDNFYGATPIKSAPEQPASGFERFEEAALGFNNIGPLQLEAQVDPENQYGHWQSVNDVTSRSMSPNKVTGESAEQFGQQVNDEDAGENNRIEGQFCDTHDISSTHHVHPQHIPNFEDGPSREEIIRPWGTISDAVEYPDLPSPKDDLGYGIPQVPQSATYRGSADMSRSQSQRSQTIDLTEDSDEGNKDEDDRDTEASFEEDNVEDEGASLQSQYYSTATEEKQPSGELKQGQEPYGDESEEDEEYDRDAGAVNANIEGDYDKEEHHDDEMDNDDGFQSGYRVNREEDFEDEDEDYDRPPGYHVDRRNDLEEEDEEEEDEEEDEVEDEEDYDDDEVVEDFEDESSPARPPVYQNPVVIDLLSSDEEEESGQVEAQVARKSVSESIQEDPMNGEDYEDDEEQNEPGEWESNDNAAHSSDPEPAMNNLQALGKKSYQDYVDDESASEEYIHEPDVNEDDSEEVESVESIEDDEDTEMTLPKSTSINEDTAVAPEERRPDHGDNDLEDVIKESHVEEDSKDEQVENVHDTENLQSPTSTDVRKFGDATAIGLEQRIKDADAEITQPEPELLSSEADASKKEEQIKDGDDEMVEPAPFSPEQVSGVVDELLEEMPAEDKEDVEMPPAERVPTDEASSSSYPIEKEGQMEDATGMPQSKPSPLNHKTDGPSPPEAETSQQNLQSECLGMEQVYKDFAKDSDISQSRAPDAAVVPATQFELLVSGDVQESGYMSSIQEAGAASPRQFSMDGAIDEYPQDIVYPVLPLNEVVELPVSGPRVPEESSSPVEGSSRQEIVQLPTPDDTQVSHTVNVQGRSFTSDMSFEAIHSDVIDPTERIQEAANNEAEIATIEDETSGINPGEDNDATAQEVVGVLADVMYVENIDDALQQAIREDQSQDEQSPEPSIKEFKDKAEALAGVKEQTAGVAELNMAEAAPATPVRRSGRNRTATPVSGRSNFSIILDDRPTPKGYDASVELAMSALDSPTKPTADIRKTNDAPLKVKLARALRTELSEFTPLKLIRYHMNKKLDILAIATTSTPEPQRAKAGPRQYQITFNITDASTGPSHITEVQVFRPYKDALPIVKVGDGILLRNFQVWSVQGGFELRSDRNEASSWAVFKGEDNEVEVRGPPVEHGPGEKEHIASLKSWYEGLDSVARAKLDRANGDKGGSSVKTRAKKAL